MRFIVAAFLLSCCGMGATQTTETAAKVATEVGESDTVVSGSSVAQLPREWKRREVEARGIWLESKMLMGSRDALTSRIEALEKAHFNTVMVATWFRGFVAYPGSKYVPMYSEIKEQDQLKWVMHQIKKRGMRAEIWPEYGFYAYHTVDSQKDKSRGPLLDAHPELAAMDAAGNAALRNAKLGDYYSLCPANPGSHALLAGLFSESIEKFDADGLNLDRIRFPAENYCYCAYCREAFKRDSGLELQVFAAGTTESKIFLKWKREQTARAAQTITSAVRSLRPNLPVTAYVAAPEEMDSKAQSWDLWVQRGYVDAVAVSMYGGGIAKTLDRSLELLEGDSTKLICAISCEQPTRGFLDNINVSREKNTLGQYIWYSGAIQDDLDALNSGPYADPAAFPPIVEATQTKPR